MSPNQRSRVSKVILVGTGLMAITVSTPVGAQARTAPSPAPAENGTASSDTTMTADIIVTAQKRSERLQDVPASVSVLSTVDLTKEGIVRFEDYASRVPGLTLTSARTGQAQITLRGITTGASQSAATTAFYIDEAPIGSVNAYTGGSSTTPDLDPSDLAQIEVLKGPQGTLYGAGAVGGLVKFVTASPDFAELGGRLSAGLTSARGGDVGYSVRGSVNIPLVSDKLVARVSGFSRRDSGYIDNVNARIGAEDINGARVYGGRAVLALKLGPDVRFDLSALAQDTRTRGTNVVDVDAVTLAPVYGELKQNRSVAETAFVSFRLYNATARLDSGSVQLLSSTTYQHTSFRQVIDNSDGFGVLLGGLFKIPGLGIAANGATRTERWSQELRAAADKLVNGLLDVQAGLYYTSEDDSNAVPSFDPYLISTGATVPLPNIVKAVILSKYKEYSVFGNATLHLSRKFDVLAGIRYSHDKQDYFQDYSGLIVGPQRINTGNESADVVTFLVSPRYRFSPDAMIYARVASGYRPGGPNAVPPPSVFVAPDTFSPDRLTQYEVGIKAALLDRKLTIDAAAFYTKWNNIQLQTSAAGFNFFVNGGSAVSQGGEVTLRLAPVAGLNLGLNAAYTDAHLSSAATAAGGLAGDRLPYVPRLSGSLTADYSVPLSEGVTAIFGGSVNRTGRRTSDYSAKFPKQLPGFTTVSLRAGIETSRFSVSAFARNLTDERGVLVVTTRGLAPSNTPGQPYSASYIQPRAVGLEAAVQF